MWIDDGNQSNYDQSNESVSAILQDIPLGPLWRIDDEAIALSSMRNLWASHGKFTAPGAGGPNRHD